MRPRQDGGAAFPVLQQESEEYPGLLTVHYGMTLRDWFAGMAVQGLLASIKVSAYTDSPKEARSIADAAWLYADALLNTREKA